MRENLVAWQWDGYPTFHRRPATLLVHLVAVPWFVASTLAVVAALATMHFAIAGAAFGSMLLAFVVQGITHKREVTPSIPFDGPVDALTRIFLEQFVTFPRFVLSGAWWRALRSPPR